MIFSNVPNKTEFEFVGVSVAEMCYKTELYFVLYVSVAEMCYKTEFEL